MIVIGIDIGGSTTKIVGFRDQVMMQPIHVKATDPITSLFGGFGRYISENNLQLSDITKIVVTGVGASFVKENIYGIPTEKVDEFKAIGMGGLYLSGLQKAVIVSMGTGTAFVRANGDYIEHLGGTGVGGGTLLGLSSKLLNMRHFDEIVNLSVDGDLGQIDLLISDMSKTKVSSMPDNTTASNFGKVADTATKADIAKGIINMVLQTIGMMSVFTCRIDGTQDVVLCGNLTNIPKLMDYFTVVEQLHGIRFCLPENAEFATALGAALTCIRQMEQQ